MRQPRNTKRSTNLRFMMYGTKSGYTAVCLDLALIREGKDPLKLKNRIERVAYNYFINVVKHNLDDNLLNQTLPEEYMTKYKDCSEAIRNFTEKKNISDTSHEAPRAIEWGNNSWPSPAKNRNLALV
jgi:hypothetical protein